MNSDLLEKFDLYIQQLGSIDPAHNDLAAEARERIQQILFITNQLQQIDEQFRQTVQLEVINAQGEKEYYNATHERNEHLRFVMRLLTESYYYFAFRLRSIFRNKVHVFPNMQSFDCPKVRAVRNHLIEHPEGASSRIFNRTFMWSQESGMHLKHGRHTWESSSFADAGFKINAKEFYDLLLAAINSALEYK